MKKWKVKLPGDRFFEMESDDPRKALAEQGYTAYALEEVIPSPLKAIRLKCLDCSCGAVTRSSCVRWNAVRCIRSDLARTPTGRA